MQNGKSNSIEKNKTRHNSWDNWLLEGWEGWGPSGYERKQQRRRMFNDYSKLQIKTNRCLLSMLISISLNYPVF